MFGRSRDRRLRMLISAAVKDHPEIAPEARAFTRVWDGVCGRDPYEAEMRETARAARDFSRSRLERI
jgi:hypothetical protein